MIKTFMTFCLLCCTLSVISNSDSLKNVRIKTYAPVFFTAGYRLPLINKSLINSGHGIYTEAGFNPAYFFSHQTILGIFVGWGWKDNLWSTAFDGAFSQDYQQAIHNDLIHPSLDSAIIHAAGNLFQTRTGSSPTPPGCEMRSFHDYSVYYGLLLKLPWRYFPAIKLYKGSNRSHYQGADGLVTTGRDYNSFQLRRSMHGCELMLLDFTGMFSAGLQANRTLERFGISVYYEYSSLSTASLQFNDGKSQRLLPLKQFVNPGFFEKYKGEQRFGCKISYTFI